MFKMYDSVKIRLIILSLPSFAYNIGRLILLLIVISNGRIVRTSLDMLKIDIAWKQL